MIEFDPISSYIGMGDGGRPTIGNRAQNTTTSRQDLRIDVEQSNGSVLFFPKQSFFAATAGRDGSTRRMRNRSFCLTHEDSSLPRRGQNSGRGDIITRAAITGASLEGDI